MSRNNREALWQSLENEAKKMQKSHLQDFFENDAARVNKYSLEFDEIYFDYSKNFLNEEIMRLLLDLAENSNLKSAIANLMSGHAVNNTENRPALHTALRKDLSTSIILHDENIIPLIKAEKEKMFRLVEQLHQGVYKGATGKKITDVVNLGIGGSDLGPVMAVEALHAYQQTNLKLHFVSNVDPDVISTLLQTLDPATTLFILSSKSFTTTETLANAQVAIEWLESHLKTKEIFAHFIAVTANPKKAEAFGIKPENILRFWDWVGGRYSIWSTIGLPLAISIGAEHFEAFLLGARKMDEHFLNAPLAENMPVLMALIGIWYINFWQAPTHAVLPYSQRLCRFPDYLQQLDMESNGKSVSADGKNVNYDTGPIVWGQAGTNGQHAFYQLLHQGTHLVPVDFIVAAKSHSTLADQHLQLVANCLAQAAALMQGTVEADIKFAHEHMPGNKPSNTLLLSKLTPRALGQLLALYEHKVFAQGIIWQINSFDQPGVELGKKLANTVIEGLAHGEISSKIDPSTKYLIERIRSE